ncbi:MAG: adenylate/guanylate cyclase with Chase sensor, partial [Proteobacteria bacterium]|nr:adenylate/guanylate cyclase with Chase sensor [Pseudomonadota bacterium]
MKKYLVRFVLGGALALVFVWNAFISGVPFLDRLDDYVYDVKVRLFAANKLDDRVVIVDIDERSLAEEGRWPWGRDKVAELVRLLVDNYKVKVIGFDVVFAEPDISSGIDVLDRLSQQQLRENAAFQSLYRSLRPGLDHDRIFANVLKTRPVVLGYYFNQAENRRYGLLPYPSFSEGGAFTGKRIDFIKNKGYGANLAIFQEAAVSAGHFNPDPDSDGTTRRVAMLVEYEGNYYESLSLAVFRRWVGNLAVRPVIPDAEGGIEWLELRSEKGSWRIPVNNRVAALVPYRGGEGSFPYVSATDVLKGKVSQQLLADKIVLVGTRAPGLNDLRATPVSGIYPGVEIHANMIAGIMDNKIKQQPDYVKALDALQILLAGSVLVFLLPLLSPLRASLVALATLIGIVSANLFFWHAANLNMPMAGVLLLSLILYGIDAAWGYFVESRTKRQFTDLFGQYVPP